MRTFVGRKTMMYFPVAEIGDPFVKRCTHGFELFYNSINVIGLYSKVMDASSAGKRQVADHRSGYGRCLFS